VISVETHSVITRRHGLTILESRSLLQKSVSTNGAADNDQRTDRKDDEYHWHEPPFFVLHQVLVPSFPCLNLTAGPGFTSISSGPIFNRHR